MSEADEKPDEGEDGGSSLTPSRRQVIGTLAGAGLLGSLASGQSGSGSGGTVLGIGGGDMADAEQEFRIKYYTSTWTQFQNEFSAEEAGRVIRIVDPGDEHHGEEYYDDGNTLGELPVNTPSVATERVDIKESLTYDYSEKNPHPQRESEGSGAPFFKPHPTVDNPIINASMIDSVESSYTVTFTADPFLLYEDAEFVLPFEIRTQNNGIKLAVATSPEVTSWGASSYQGILTADSSELGTSYPYMLKWNGTWYLAAETGQLYEATDFPLEWTEVEGLNSTMTDNTMIDRTLFRWGGRWWCIAGNGSDNLVFNHSEETDEGPAGRTWSEPSWSPLTTDTGSGSKRESPSCHPIVQQDGIIVFYEDHSRSQTHMSSYRISELTPTAHTQTEVAASPATFAWGGFGSSHHLDALIQTPGGTPVAVADVGTPWEIWLLQRSEAYPANSKANLSTNQTVESGTGFNDIEFDVVQNDTIDFLGHFDPENHHYTVPTPGFYQFDVQLQINSWGAGNVASAELRLRDSGSIDIDNAIGEGEDAYINLSEYRWFDGGEQVFVRMSTTGGNATIASGNLATKFVAKRD